MLVQRSTPKIVAVLFSGLVFAACGREDDSLETESSAVCANNGVVEGVDVSDFQGYIDWNSAHAAGIGFAAMKATQGTYNTNSTFAHNWEGSRAAGVMRSAYHFFDPWEDGVAQAQHFLAVVGRIEPDDLPPMLDVECPDADYYCLGWAGGTGIENPQVILRRVLDWLHTVEAATGKKPMIYTFSSYFSSNGIDASALADYPLFLAYLTDGLCIGVPWPWTAAPIWQYSWHGRVAGIVGEVDRDRFNGTIEALRAFAGASGNGGGFSAGIPADDGRSVARNQDGRIEAFVRASDGSVRHTWQSEPNGAWEDWYPLGGMITGRPLAVANADGRLEVFGRGADGAVEHAWQLEPNGVWSDWERLGASIAGDPAGARNQDGRIEIFARVADGSVWHTWQVEPNGTWEDWYPLGGDVVNDLSIASNPDGRLELFARGSDDALWHVWQTEPNGEWSDWMSLGGIIRQSPHAGRNADGRLEVFVEGADHGLWHIWQTAPGSEPWSDWFSSGGAIGGDFSVDSNADGRLEVFARGADGASSHIWQVEPNATWSGWESIGGDVTLGPVVTRNADGRFEVFGRGSDGALWHAWQTELNGKLTDWQTLGGDVAGL